MRHDFDWLINQASRLSSRKRSEQQEAARDRVQEAAARILVAGRDLDLIRGRIPARDLVHGTEVDAVLARIRVTADVTPAVIVVAVTIATRIRTTTTTVEDDIRSAADTNIAAAAGTTTTTTVEGTTGHTIDPIIRITKVTDRLPFFLFTHLL